MVSCNGINGTRKGSQGKFMKTLLETLLDVVICLALEWRQHGHHEALDMMLQVLTVGPIGSCSL